MKSLKMQRREKEWVNGNVMQCHTLSCNVIHYHALSFTRFRFEFIFVLKLMKYLKY